MTVLALATAIGGGIVRDVLLGYFPPNSFAKYSVYVTVVLVVTVIVFLIYNSRYRKAYDGTS